MHARLFPGHRFVFCPLLAMVLAAVPVAARADGGPIFSGQATALSANVLGISQQFSDTGAQNSSQFAEQRSGPSVSVAFPTPPGGSLSAETLHASTIGQGDRARSEASLAEVNLTVAGNSVSSSFLMANAMAVCTGSGPSVTGSSQLADLSVDGQPIQLSGGPQTQTVSTAAGSVTVSIDEQQQSGNSIDVTALEVVVKDSTGTTLADVAFSHVHADVSCGATPNCGSAKDFVTGGGWIIPPNATDRANFGVGGGTLGQPGWGHLEYIDHNTGVKVHGTGVTAYTAPTPTTRHIEGSADYNGQPANYKVDVGDNDDATPPEPDSFAIQVLDLSGTPLYGASGTLGGGEIQIHSPCH